MNDIIFIDFFALITRLYQFNTKFRINNKICEIVFKKIVLKETFIIISRSREDFLITSNLYPQIENQFIEFTKFES